MFDCSFDLSPGVHFHIPGKSATALPDAGHAHTMCIAACSGAANDFNWRLVNGLWGLILAVGLLWTSLTIRQARSWLYFRGWARSLLADYGVPLLVVIWSAVGYAVNSGTPNGIPRRTRIPNTWDEKTNWTVARVNAFHAAVRALDLTVSSHMHSCIVVSSTTPKCCLS